MASIAAFNAEKISATGHSPKTNGRTAISAVTTT